MFCDMCWSRWPYHLQMRVRDFKNLISIVFIHDALSGQAELYTTIIECFKIY